MDTAESKIDYEGFTITVEVHNPEYLTGEVNQTEVERGSGYLLFVNQADGVQVIKHGYTSVRGVVKGMARVVSAANALHKMIANVIMQILYDDRVDLAKFYLQGADILRDWPKLREGSVTNGK